MLSLPQLSISAFFLHPYVFLSSHPSSYRHLLSQGPCGTLRGWWGWGWWWCRWWWNSHSVSSLPVFEAEVSPSLSLFPSPHTPAFVWRQREESEEKDKETGFLSLPQFHPRIFMQHTPPSRPICHLCLCVHSLFVFQAVFVFNNFNNY